MVLDLVRAMIEIIGHFMQLLVCWGASVASYLA
jgi:hypothetical protein